MKTIKVIDLLNKIANGEEVPKKIKYTDDIYIHTDNYCYYCKETNKILSQNIYAEFSRLNDEIEIIEDTPKEDKKIEKTNRENISLGASIINEKIRNVDCYIFDKLDEIIDMLNGE